MMGTSANVIFQDVAGKISGSVHHKYDGYPDVGICVAKWAASNIRFETVKDAMMNYFEYAKDYRMKQLKKQLEYLDIKIDNYERNKTIYVHEYPMEIRSEFTYTIIIGKNSIYIDTYEFKGTNKKYLQWIEKLYR